MLVWYGIVGFLCGFLLLSVSSRLLKSFGWETGFTVSNMLHIPKRPNVSKKRTKKYEKLLKLWRRFFIFSLIYGVLFSGIFVFLFYSLDMVSASWIAAMLLTVAVAGLIDLKIWILPDFLTIPLIISGLSISYYVAPLVNIEESILGCTYGYVMPLLATLFMQKFHESPLGGGDVKIMAGVGAWVGFTWFNIILVSSFIAFAVFALLRKSNVCPYGPPLTIAVIICVILQVVINNL